mmetsp:Transcript_7569/g.9893  ORF Transcript_7569/g.9893 Transcript_7569/m.9893 type:complete len:194 (+) Transcript_7569:73-654(+)
MVSILLQNKDVAANSHPCSGPSTASLTSLASTTYLEESSSLDRSSLHSVRSVKFATIQIREYKRTVGDHPEVLRGAPMSLDWDYNQHDHVCVSDYEENRSAKRTFLRIDSYSRQQLLMDQFEISLEELQSAEKEAKMIRDQRAESKKDGESLADKFEMKRKPLGYAKKGDKSAQGKKPQRKGFLKFFKRSATV